MAILSSTGRFAAGEACADNDILYGPYTTKAAAHAALLNAEQNVIGRTVGIQTGNTIEEYWYQGGTEQANLVKKQSSDVEANPEGEYPSAVELDSIRIDEQVYVVPTPRTPDTQLSDTSTNAVQNKVVKAALDEKAPASNIQKTALANDVQTSLGKADTALQPTGFKTINNESIVGTGNITIESGQPGAPGQNAYVHIKYAVAVPASAQDMRDYYVNGDKYIGVYSGDSAIAPDTVNSYQWAKFVGDDGASAVNSFKGLFPSAQSLYASVQATAGDYAYVLNSNDSTASVYIYDSTASSTNYWSDSGNDFDLSSVNINGGLHQNAKNLILSLFRKCTYVSNDAEDYIDDLEEEFEDTRTLQRIEATFTQGANVIYDDASLNSLKQYLTVEAYYDNGTHETVNNADVLLGGALTAGTSTITASYEGKTDDFTVTVTAAPVVVSIAANYTGGDVIVNSDIVNLKADLTVTATLDNSNTRVLAADEYSLNGDLTTAGTAQITVTYLANSSITTTFNVTVSTSTLSLLDSDIVKHRNNTYNMPDANPPYTIALQSRCCYPYFDKHLAGGRTYQVVIHSNYEVTGVVQAFSQSGLSKISNGQNYLSPTSPNTGTVDSWDSGWLQLTNGEGSVTVPQYTTGSSQEQLIEVARFAFKRTDQNGANFPDDVEISMDIY